MRLRKGAAVFAALSLLLPLLPSALAEEGAILENSGFEAVNDENNIPHWWTTVGDLSDAKITASDISYAGNVSAFISGRVSADAGVKQYYQTDRLSGGADYEAKAYIKYTGDSAPADVEFSLVFVDYNSEPITMASKTVKKDRWTEVKGCFKTPETLSGGFVCVKTNETESFVDYYIDCFALTADPYIVEEGDFIVNGTFDTDGDPWFGFGGGSVSVVDGILKSTGRAYSWVGLGQVPAKKMRSGHRYKISADVMYDGEAGTTAGVNLTLVNNTGVEGDPSNYTSLAVSTVNSGEWTHIDQLVTLPEGILDNQSVYFGTATDEQLCDLYIDNVSITEVEDDGALAKTVGNSNPLMSHCFGADPYAMEYNGRLYIYMSSDAFEYDADGNLVTNSFAELKGIKCISTEDMVNWTDHGVIPVAGAESSSFNEDGSVKTHYDGFPNGGARWAGLSWAPAAAHKTIDGKEKFFLYFANAGGGIGVLEGDSPTGPFIDPTVSEAHPYGTTILTPSDILQDGEEQIPGTEKVRTWYDPAVLVDDDGTGYIYFGGGFGEDSNYPDSVCVAQLSDDMTSVVGEAKSINAPGLFEDSGIHKYNGKYYYSYSSNFEKNMTAVEPGVIYYLVSDSPMGTFVSPVEGEPAGKVLDNMYMFFKTGGNNHHAIFEFKDQWYIVYHAETLGLAISGDTSKLYGYRSPHISRLEYDEDGVIKPVVADYKGVSQIKSLNPYETVEAETIAWNAGIKVELIDTPEDCRCGSMKVTDIEDGDWIAVSGADFGESGANVFTARVNAAVKSHIEIHADSRKGDMIGELDLEPTDGFAELSCAVDRISGVHDIYLVFKGEGEDLVELDS